jgi:hypothetical protein
MKLIILKGSTLRTPGKCAVRKRRKINQNADKYTASSSILLLYEPTTEYTFLKSSKMISYFYSYLLNRF